MKSSFQTLKLLVSIVGFGSLPIANGQTPVRVSEIRVEHIQQRQTVTGSLRATSRGDVAALESGRLVKLTVRAGDKVTKGQVIAKVDARRLQAQRSAAEADLHVAEAEVKRHVAVAKRAAADLARSEKLIRQNAVSRQELDGYRAAAEVSLAEIESAKRQIDQAKEAIHLIDVRLSDTAVTAPYDASVVARHVEPGDWVGPGDPLLTLVSTGPIEAWLEVPERFAAALDSGDDIALDSVASKNPLRVLNTKRVADVNPRVRTIQLIATLENPMGELSPGMSVRGWVPSGTAGEFLTVPKDAIVRRSGQPTVFSVDEHNNSSQIAVRVLFETKYRVAVQSPDLSPDKLVIVEGNERLMPNQLVRVIRDVVQPSLKIVQQ